MAKRTASALLCLLWATASLAQVRKLAPDLPAHGNDRIDVIVQFRSEPGAADHHNVEQRGGLLKRSLPKAKAAVYSMTATAAVALAQDPEVLYISPDRPVHRLLDITSSTSGAQYALASGWDGRGIGIAVIDSGISDVRDLLAEGSRQHSASRVAYSETFVNGASSTLDQHGHGTHVAGIMAGNGNASTGAGYFKTFRGIAPNAKIINLRVLDENGGGTDSTVIAAIDRAIQLKDEYNIRVMNISLGRPVYESYTKDPLCLAVERAWKAGIVVVVAAGNGGRNTSRGTDGYATITSPANDPLVITVGAMKSMETPSRADDLMASYSSKGPTLLDHVVKPDIVAPGNRVVSLMAPKTAVAQNSTTNRIPYSYYHKSPAKAYSAEYCKLSGTSMAAPMVAGAAALMLQKDGTLSPDTIKARLMRSASKSFPSYSTVRDEATGVTYTTQYDIFTVGAGYLEIAGALNDPHVVAPGSTAASPQAVFDTATNTVRIVNTDTSVWGKAAIWGTSDVWGSAAIWGTNVFVDGQAAIWGTAAIWGSAAVWGTSTTQGNAAIWGTAAIWRTAAIWGTTSTTDETLSQLINGED